jgi:hypothetical protein
MAGEWRSEHSQIFTRSSFLSRVETSLLRSLVYRNSHIPGLVSSAISLSVLAASSTLMYNCPGYPVPVPFSVAQCYAPALLVKTAFIIVHFQ